MGNDSSAILSRAPGRRSASGGSDWIEHLRLLARRDSRADPTAYRVPYVNVRYRAVPRRTVPYRPNPQTSFPIDPFQRLDEKGDRAVSTPRGIPPRTVQHRTVQHRTAQHCTVSSHAADASLHRNRFVGYRDESGRAVPAPWAIPPRTEPYHVVPARDRHSPSNRSGGEGRNASPGGTAPPQIMEPSPPIPAGRGA